MKISVTKEFILKSLMMANSLNILIVFSGIYNLKIKEQ